MANRLMLHYFPGDSFLHRWDARGKLPGMLVASALIMQNRPVVLAGLTLVFSLALRLGGIPIKRLGQELRAWLPFFLIIVLVTGLSNPGSSMEEPLGYSMSAPGIREGLRICWRLLLLLIAAILFSCLTKPREVRDAILWLLKPLPFLPRYRIAFMAGLTMRLVPLVLDELDAIRAAHKSRGGERRKNPWHRVKHLVLPLFRRIFSRADDLALALAARCYREDLPVEWPRLPPTHLLPAALLVVFWIAGFVC